MGTGASPNSSRRKNASEDRRKRKKKTKRTAKSSKRRRHDSPLTSSGSGGSSPSASSSDSEVGGGRGPRGGQSKKEALVRQQRSLSRDVVSSQHQKKKKKGYRGERDLKRRDSRSKLSKGDRQKKAHDRRGRRHRRGGGSSIRSRSTSVSSEDGYSTRSCSTCRSYSSSPERTKAGRSLRSKGGKVQRARMSTRGRTSSRRDREKSDRRHSRGRHTSRSPSCSSCSRWSHEDRSRSQVSGNGNERRLGDGMLAEKNHSRHPPSISNSLEHPNEVEDRYYSSTHENRAEIIEDFDDLRTSRSNDSDDGARKGDSGMTTRPQALHSPERRRHDDSPGSMRKNWYIDRVEAGLTREISSSVVVTERDGGAKRGNRNDLSMPRDTQPRLKSQVSTSGGGSDADDLELLLRQKALENFQKFRARISSNASFVEEHAHKSNPTKAHEVTTGKSEAEQTARPTMVPAKQKSSTSLECHSFVDGESHSIQFESALDANTPAVPHCLVEDTDRNAKKLMQRHPGHNVNTEIVHDSLFPNSDPCSKEFQPQSSGKVFGEYLSSENMSVNKSSATAGRTIIDENEGNRADVSASTDTSCHGNASEFEQKTMSVMHGGEMVQVSYKVYIPKNTPALAKRRLQR